MDVLLPGLLKAMEERLGRIGRPLTTILVVCLALGAIAWGLKLFGDNAVYPIVQLIQNTMMDPQLFLEELKGVVLPLTVFFAVLILLSVIQRIWSRRWITKINQRRDEADARFNQQRDEVDVKLRQTEETHKHILEAYSNITDTMQEFNKVASRTEQMLLKIESTSHKEDSETE